jgi:hypothetical protein
MRRPAPLAQRQRTFPSGQTVTSRSRRRLAGRVTGLAASHGLITPQGTSMVMKMTVSRSEEVLGMTTIDSWLVEIFLREQDRETRAEARLTKGVGGLTGQGTARRNPEDREATQIGEEIAAARALSDLAHKLLDAAAGDIEAITHQRAHLHL